MIIFLQMAPKRKRSYTRRYKGRSKYRRKRRYKRKSLKKYIKKIANEEIDNELESKQIYVTPLPIQLFHNIPVAESGFMHCMKGILNYNDYAFESFTSLHNTDEPPEPVGQPSGRLGCYGRIGDRITPKGLKLTWYFNLGELQGQMYIRILIVKFNPEYVTDFANESMSTALLFRDRVNQGVNQIGTNIMTDRLKQRHFKKLRDIRFRTPRLGNQNGQGNAPATSSETMITNKSTTTTPFMKSVYINMEKWQQVQYKAESHRDAVTQPGYKPMNYNIGTFITAYREREYNVAHCDQVMCRYELKSCFYYRDG